METFHENHASAWNPRILCVFSGSKCCSHSRPHNGIGSFCSSCSKSGVGPGFRRLLPTSDMSGLTAVWQLEQLCTDKETCETVETC